jgi:hypothetical protein
MQQVILKGCRFPVFLRPALRLNDRDPTLLDQTTAIAFDASVNGAFSSEHCCSQKTEMPACVTGLVLQFLGEKVSSFSFESVKLAKERNLRGLVAIGSLSC